MVLILRKPHGWLAKHVFLFLGWWHVNKVFVWKIFVTKKILAEHIWKKFLPFLIGPFLRTCWPLMKLFFKPKLQVLLF